MDSLVFLRSNNGLCLRPPDKLVLESDANTSGVVHTLGYLTQRRQLVDRYRTMGMINDAGLLWRVYQAHGLQTPKHLSGPFSWILYDSDNRRLLVVRDRLGIQPIYYFVSPAMIAFATRPEALLALNLFSPIANQCAMARLLLGQHPLPGESYYEQIKVVEPGHFLFVTPDQVRDECYWQPSLQPLLRLSSDAEYGEAYREMLFDVVKEHVSVRPGGVTITAGLDSNSVALVLSQVADTCPIGLTMSAPDLVSANEYPWARQVADRLHIPLYAIRADENWELKPADSPKTYRGTPYLGFYRPTWEALYCLAKEQGVQVIYTGAGGDFLFGANVSAYPDLLISGQWLELTRQLHQHTRQSKTSLGKIIRDLILRPLKRHWIPPRSYYPPYLLPAARRLLAAGSATTQQSPMALPGRRQRVITLCAPSSAPTVEIAQRQAAKFGIELRHPLLDERLFDFAASLPATQTFHSAQRKWIVRNGLRNDLPAEVLDRWGKIYPTAIAERGLRERETGKVWALMQHMRLAEAGLVDEVRLRQSYQDYLDGKSNHVLFWYTITLEDWLRRWF